MIFIPKKKKYLPHVHYKRRCYNFFIISFLSFELAYASISSVRHNSTLQVLRETGTSLYYSTCANLRVNKDYHGTPWSTPSCSTYTCYCTPCNMSLFVWPGPLLGHCIPCKASVSLSMQDNSNLHFKDTPHFPEGATTTQVHHIIRPWTTNDTHASLSTSCTPPSSWCTYSRLSYQEQKRKPCATTYAFAFVYCTMHATGLPCQHHAYLWNT
jgi:hypothetical protein